ncbi:MAG: LysR family transcriptional regulator [Coprococcus sp.]
MIESLNNYYIFYIVAKTGNISRAANQLFISQPAISKAISKLEHELEADLFSRSSRGVSLTEEGQVLYEYVERAFDNLNKGEESLKKYTELGLGHIRIGVSTSLCKHILLDYLKEFIRENPHIKFSIDCHSTLNTIRLLKNDEIDIGLICDTELPKGIVYSPVMKIHDIFVASSDYIENFNLRETEEENFEFPSNISGNILGNVVPLLNRSTGSSNVLRQTAASLKGNNNSSESNASAAINKRSLSDSTTRELLEKSNLMVLEESNVTRTHVDNYLRKHSINCSQVIEINNMDLLIDFAAIGMGVASVVREFALSQLKSGQIVELPLETSIDERTVGFAYSESKKQSTAVKKFLEYVAI